MPMPEMSTLDRLAPSHWSYRQLLPLSESSHRIGFEAMASRADTALRWGKLGMERLVERAIGRFDWLHATGSAPSSIPSLGRMARCRRRSLLQHRYPSATHVALCGLLACLLPNFDHRRIACFLPFRKSARKIVDARVTPGNRLGRSIGGIGAVTAAVEGDLGLLARRIG